MGAYSTMMSGYGPGLLKRRYSVPEIIMRKHTLAQQKTYDDVNNNNNSIKSKTNLVKSRKHLKCHQPPPTSSPYHETQSLPPILTTSAEEGKMASSPASLLGSSSFIHSRNNSNSVSRNGSSGVEYSMRKSTLLRRIWNKKELNRYDTRSGSWSPPLRRAPRRIYSIESIVNPPDVSVSGGRTNSDIGSGSSDNSLNNSFTTTCRECMKLENYYNQTKCIEDSPKRRKLTSSNTSLSNFSPKTATTAEAVFSVDSSVLTESVSSVTDGHFGKEEEIDQNSNGLELIYMTSVDSPASAVNDLDLDANSISILIDPKPQPDVIAELVDDENELDEFLKEEQNANCLDACENILKVDGSPDSDNNLAAHIRQSIEADVISDTQLSNGHIENDIPLEIIEEKEVENGELPPHEDKPVSEPNNNVEVKSEKTSKTNNKVNNKANSKVHDKANNSACSSRSSSAISISSDSGKSYNSHSNSDTVHTSKKPHKDEKMSRSDIFANEDKLDEFISKLLVDNLNNILSNELLVKSDHINNNGIIEVNEMKKKHKFFLGGGSSSIIVNSAHLNNSTTLIKHHLKEKENEKENEDKNNNNTTNAKKEQETHTNRQHHHHHHSKNEKKHNGFFLIHKNSKRTDMNHNYSQEIDFNSKYYFPSYGLDSTDYSDHTEIQSDSEPSILGKIGTGSCYPDFSMTRSVIVTRFSALPRTESMEVQPSSTSGNDEYEDLAGNESDTSLVDSLDEKIQMTPRKRHEKMKLARKSLLTKENLDSMSPSKIPIDPNAEVKSPRHEKGEAYFIPIQDTDQVMDEHSIHVSEMMPLAIKQRLNNRQKLIVAKKQQETLNKHRKTLRNLEQRRFYGDSAIHVISRMDKSISKKEIIHDRGVLFGRNPGRTGKAGSGPKKSIPFLLSELGMLESYKIDARGNMQIQPSLMPVFAPPEANLKRAAKSKWGNIANKMRQKEEDESSRSPSLMNGGEMHDSYPPPQSRQQNLAVKGSRDKSISPLRSIVNRITSKREQSLSPSRAKSLSKNTSNNNSKSLSSQSSREVSESPTPMRQQKDPSSSPIRRVMSKSFSQVESSLTESDQSTVSKHTTITTPSSNNNSAKTNHKNDSSDLKVGVKTATRNAHKKAVENAQNIPPQNTKTSQGVTPQSVTPQSVTPQSVSPQSVTPQSETPVDARRKQVLKDVQQMTFSPHADLTPDIEGGPRRMYQKTEIQEGDNKIEILEIVECPDKTPLAYTPKRPRARSGGTSRSAKKSRIPVPIYKYGRYPRQFKSSLSSRESSPLSSASNPKTDKMIADMLIDALNNPDDADVGVKFINTPEEIKEKAKKTPIVKKSPSAVIPLQPAPQQPAVKRPPTNSAKYLQRLEIVPEERSSVSLQSSTEDLSSSKKETSTTSSSRRVSFDENAKVVLLTDPIMTPVKRQTKSNQKLTPTSTIITTSTKKPAPSPTKTTPKPSPKPSPNPSPMPSPRRGLPSSAKPAILNSTPKGSTVTPSTDEGWTVTVAGNYNPENPPDVEMRLSFPKGGEDPNGNVTGPMSVKVGAGGANSVVNAVNGRKIMSESVSQLPSQKTNFASMDSDYGNNRPALPPSTSSVMTNSLNLNPKRTLTRSDGVAGGKNYRLPNVGSSSKVNVKQPVKKAIKTVECSVITSASRTISNYQPHGSHNHLNPHGQHYQNQNSRQRSLSYQTLKPINQNHHGGRANTHHHLQNHQGHHDSSVDISTSYSRRMSLESQQPHIDSLSVMGNSITREMKPKVPTMSEKDLTRRHHPCYTRTLPYFS